MTLTLTDFDMTTRRLNIKTLYRDPEHAVIGGVCAGIAEYLNIDVLLARITALVLLVMTFGLIVSLYLVFWAILPAKPQESSVIDIKPASISSENYSKVVSIHALRKQRAETTSEAKETKLDKAISGKFSTRVYLIVLCLEICVLLLPFITGLCTLESLSLIDNTTFLIWFIAAVFALGAIVFNNSACYVTAIVLILLATLLSFANFGIFEPATFIAWLDSELRPA